MTSRRRPPSPEVPGNATVPEADDWSPDSTPFVEGYDVSAPVPVLVGVGVPAVVAVVVTRDPGPQLAATLASIDLQEYANLTTLVIDAGSAEDPTERVAAVSPSAFVKRVDSTTFAASANQALGTVEGASFFLFCHDDVELGPGSVQAMVEEAFRSNAGVVGAKIVDWDEPQRLRSVGAAIDKFGFIWPNAEVGELDQAQHDAVTECFVVSTAAMLVRCDLFADIGGFSVDIDGYGEDLDFCWRARIAGGRTVVMPAAKVRHRASSMIGENLPEASDIAHRNRARLIVANYSPLHLLRVAPQSFAFAVGEMVAALVSGRLSVAKGILRAILWNIGHLPATMRVRGTVKRSRHTQDDEIRRLQVKGSTRFTSFIRNQTAADRSFTETLTAATRGLSGADGPDGRGTGPWPVVAILVAGLLLLLGSRGLITGGVPAIREFVPLGRPGALLREWWSGWRSTGLGGRGGAPTIDLVAGLAGGVTFGSDGFVRLLLMLSPLPLGAVATWRLFRGTVSTSSRVASLVAYLVNPLPYNAIAEGRWQGLVAYAAAPALLGRIGRAGRWAPFVRADEPPTSLIRQIIGFGLLVAAATTVAPVVAVIAVLVGVVVVSVMAVSDRSGDIRAAVAVVGGELGISALVHLPWTIDVMANSNRWTLLLGAEPTRGTPISLGRAMLFHTGVHGGALSAGLLLAAVVVMVISRHERFRWSIVSMALIVVSFASVVLAGRLAPSIASADPEVLLALAATGVTISLALGLESFRTDVMGGAFGWRQVLSVAAAAGVVVAVLPALLDVSSGTWKAPTSDVDRALTPIRGGRVPKERTLWIADGDVLQGQGWSLGDGMKFAVTDGVRPSVSSLFPAAMGDGERKIRSAIRSLVDGRASRSGAVLAPLGIRYVVVQTRLAPLPYGSTLYPVDPALSDRLDQQLDISRLEVAPGLDVYENLIRTPIPSEHRIRSTVSGDNPGPESTTIVAHVVQLLALVAAAVLWRRSRPTVSTGVPGSRGATGPASLEDGAS